MKMDELDLPISLKRKLDAVENRLCRLELVVAICGALFAFFLAYLVLFGLDRLTDTPALLRMGLAIGAAVLGGIFAWRFMRHWFWKRRDARDMARIVQREHKMLGDRLLGVVELAEGKNTTDGASPALVRAAINQVAHESDKVDFQEAVSARSSWKWALGFATLAIGAFMAYSYSSRAATNTVKRLVNPTAERYTLVQLKDLPTGQVVPHGEPFRMAVALNKASEWKPKDAVASIEGQAPVDSEIRFHEPTREHYALFHIPRQTKPADLRIRIGDASRDIALTPKHRPALSKLEATIAYPEYLGADPIVRTLNTTTLHVPEGGSFELAGTIQGDRSEVEDGADSTDIPRQITRATLETREGDQAGSVEPLAIEAGVFRTPELKPEGLEQKTLLLSWRDEHQLETRDPWPIKVKTVRDLPPEVDILDVERTLAILEDEVVEPLVVARDDFMLRKLGVDWESIQDPDKGIRETFGSIPMVKDDAQEVAHSASFKWSPFTEHVPVGSIIRMVATALDNYPKRDASQSLDVLIRVLSPSEHAEILEQRMKNLQAEMDDLAHDEEGLIDQNKEMAGDNPELLDPKKLSAQEMAERSQEKEMERLADKAKEIVEDALKNNAIDPRTLREWAEMSEAMKNLSQEELKEAAEQLGQAADQKQSPQQRKEKLDKAIAKQKDALKKMREMEKKANESITDMMARNFVNRLKERANEEGEIGGGLVELFNEAPGDEKEDLPEELVELVEELAAGQLYTRKQAGFIQEELFAFYGRTKEQVYKDIHDAMLKEDTMDSLEKLSNLIERNNTGLAMRGAKKWKDLFSEWAGKIEKESKSGEGGGEGLTPEQIDMEILFALMRARNHESRIRDNTIILEDIREDNPAHEEDAYKLGKRQDALSDGLRILEPRARHPQVKEMVVKIVGLMDTVKVMLRNEADTGTETVAIENEIIEDLSKAIDEQASQARGLPGMPGPPGQKPGSRGNEQLYPSDMTAEDAEGRGDEKDGEARTPGRIAGYELDALPEEFRDLMENYLNSIEGAD